jgi:tetratricopeptide (TPR) repeat protein
MRANAEAVRGYELAGNWRDGCVIRSFQGKALMDLGDRAGAEAILRANLALAEQRGEALPLTYARVELARFLAHFAPIEQLGEPEQIARAAITGKNASLMGRIHGVLAEAAFRRGDLEAAEAAAREAHEWTRPFPIYSWTLIALRVRILLALGRTAESLGLAEETLQRFESIGLLGHGEMELRLATVEARIAADHPEAARELLRTTLSRLRLLTDDIPEATARTRYLTEVQTHARLLALARESLGEEAVRAVGLVPEAQGSA